jgi:hypothetical protein
MSLQNSETKIHEVLVREGLEEVHEVLKKHNLLTETALNKVLEKKDEIKYALDLLKSGGLTEFIEDVVLSYSPAKRADELVKVKDALKKIVEKYDNGKVAFEKANNANTFVYLTFRTEEDVEELEKLAVEMDELINGAEPKVIEMSYEEFVQRYKPKLVWYNKKSGKGTYSVLMGGYRFARNYRVIIMRVRSLPREAISVLSKLTRNVYPVSLDDDELVPGGLIIFVPN